MIYAYNLMFQNWLQGEKMEEKDVIIIGAGLAGLTAAYELKKAGRSVQVVEARDRVGGRTMEGKLLDRSFDLGGQWVGPTQTRIMAMIKELDLSTFPQHSDGYQLVEMHGKLSKYKGVIPKLPILALLSADRAIKKINRLAQSLAQEPWNDKRAEALDTITAEHWIQGVPTKIAREMIRIAIRAIFSGESSEISFLYFLNYIQGAGSFELLADVEGAAQQDRILGGAFQIARKMADRIGTENISLSSPVRSIEQSGSEVLVRTHGGEFRGKFCIVALSPNLTTSIHFSPAPLERLSLARRMPMGSVTKAIVAYDAPFWRKKDMAGMAISDAGPFGPVFDACLPDDPRGYLVGFLEGEEGRRYAMATEDQRKQAIVETLVRFFGPEAGKPIGYVEKNWTMDEWSAGCYTGLMIPGTMMHYGKYLREPAGRIHWAGTETAERWMGYFDGAVESGQRTRDEILSRYQ